jgi:serine/threonine protein kinase
MSVANGIATELGHKTLGEVIGLVQRGMQVKFTKENGEVIEWNATKQSMAAFGIAAGMCYLHEHNIIHRDLNTENVMLDSRLRVRICAFGLSNAMSSDDEMAGRVDGMWLALGTSLYMAPELLLEREEGYTTAVDVYAYAMVLYELCVGEKPWSNPRDGGPQLTLFNLMRNVKKGKRPTVPDWVHPAYKELMTKCWAQNPEERPTFRQIVEPNMGNRLSFPETDIGEYEAYQREMMTSLGPARRSKRN